MDIRASVRLIEREAAGHTIPEMTHPLARYWRQPNRDAITIDDTHAIMSQETFDALADYSCSVPTGVYDGKMWKYGRPYREPRTEWWLCWFAPSDKPDCCSTHTRRIIIV
jgi:hypothetical protein